MAPNTSDYEKRRLQNIEDNKRVLSELGLLNPYLKQYIGKRTSTQLCAQQKPVLKKPQKRLLSKPSSPVTDDEFEQKPLKRRKSARLHGIDPTDAALEEFENEENVSPVRKVYVPKDNVYGSIEGVVPGTWWETRMECSRDGVHRPTVAGIHGNTETGAYSIALSGGYEDNVDLGDCFTYTGEGGRDLKGTRANPKNLRTAAQSKDQTLTRGNLALSQSVKTQNPVRVIRGYKLPTIFAPETGYRYDGLYTVTKCWYATGASGFGVWKFALKRCPGQLPLPFEVEKSQDDRETYTLA
ncbi:uncharacterized protein [Watersipora subatra]|uniref:uncharacterized protein n=1 Tax=Watersipora subatra TaxID=2589382 RepID=UPI00355C640A